MQIHSSFLVGCQILFLANPATLTPLTPRLIGHMRFIQHASHANILTYFTLRALRHPRRLHHPSAVLQSFPI